MMNSDIELMEILIGKLSEAIYEAQAMQDMYSSDWDASKFLERVEEIRNQMLLPMGRIIHGND